MAPSRCESRNTAIQVLSWHVCHQPMRRLPLNPPSLIFLLPNKKMCYWSSVNICWVIIADLPVAPDQPVPKATGAYCRDLVALGS